MILNEEKLRNIIREHAADGYINMLFEQAGADPAKIKRKAKLVYDKFIKGNFLKHNHVIACLQEEIKSRTRGGNLQYMHALETYINKNAWDAYASFIPTNDNVSTSDTKYGEDLI